MEVQKNISGYLTASILFKHQLFDVQNPLLVWDVAFTSLIKFLSILIPLKALLTPIALNGRLSKSLKFGLEKSKKKPQTNKKIPVLFFFHSIFLSIPKYSTILNHIILQS